MNEFFLEYARVFQLTTYIKHILLHIEKKEKVLFIKKHTKKTLKRRLFNIYFRRFAFL